MFSLESIGQIMQNAIYVVLLVGLGLSLYTVKTIGKGVLSILFVSFAYGIFFVGMSMVFNILVDMGIYNLGNVTLHIWWHGIVNLGLLSLIWGGYRVKNIVKTESTEGIGVRDLLVFTIMVMVMAVIFIAAPILEGSLASRLTGSIVDSWGLHHFSVFTLAGIAAWYLFYIKGKWGALGVSIMFVVGFLALISTQHLWELLTESWKVVILKDEIIELVEMFVVLPALILFALGQWKIVKYLKN